MNDPWLNTWNDRFSREDFAYGVEPNHYLKEQLEKLKPGKIIFPAEGEGRNAVYAYKNVGGPKDIDMLFSKDEIRSDFGNYDIVELEEKEIELNEGQFHNGTGSVIRFVGRKK